jgi:hypothetical protein
VSVTPQPAVQPIQEIEEIQEIQPIRELHSVPTREKAIKAKRPPARAPVDRPPPKLSFDQRLASLDDRAQRMWKQLPPDDPRREAMAKLIRDLSMTKNALSRMAQPENELVALEERIDAIEK